MSSTATAGTTPGREGYHSWRSQITRQDLRGIDSFSSLVTHDATYRLSDITGLPDDEAAWLAGTTLHAKRWQIPIDDAQTFLFRWGSRSPKREGGVHINEMRFQRWIGSQHDVQQWYKATLTGLRVVRAVGFSRDSLYDLAVLRTISSDTGVEQFSFACAEQFYAGQKYAKQ